MKKLSALVITGIVFLAACSGPATPGSENPPANETTANENQPAQDNNQPAEENMPESPIPEKSTAPAGSETYKLDTANSSFAWHGTKVTGEHNGTIAIEAGEVFIADNAVVGGWFDINMNTIKDLDLEDPSTLEQHLMSPDFFDAAKYPWSRFIITKVEVLKGTETQNPPAYNITGNLYIKGITNQITFPARIWEQEGGNYMGTAEFKLDRTLWNVKYGSGKFFKGLGDTLIYDEFDVTLNLLATK